MACWNRQFARIVTSSGWTPLLLALVLAASQVYAQAIPPRLRGGPERDQPDPAAASAQPAPTQSAPAQQASAPQPPSAAPASQVAPSMLQQPASEAQIDFTGETLSIRADNSSLSAILHQVATKSGMRIEGLSGDERVFGTFGPGAPRDVIADLLNGTAYNVVLLGDLSNGAPRELILTPATHGGAAPPPAARVDTDEASVEPEPPEVVPPPAEVPAAGTTPPPTPGVKTPQQLFEQLQRMRSAQQQQGGTTQDPQQSQQAPQ